MYKDDKSHTKSEKPQKKQNRKQSWTTDFKEKKRWVKKCKKAQ